LHSAVLPYVSETAMVVDPAAFATIKRKLVDGSTLPVATAGAVDVVVNVPV